MMRASFNPSNWYWIVSGSAPQVYSSSIGDYVVVGDPNYQAWLAAGNSPTSIDTETNLGQLLSTYLLRPVNASVLDKYTAALATGIVAQVIFKILFNHENRLRACERALSLNGSPQPLTAAQAIAAVKALM